MEQENKIDYLGNETPIIGFRNETALEGFVGDLIEDIQDEIFTKEQLITFKNALNLIIQKIDQKLAGD